MRQRPGAQRSKAGVSYTLEEVEKLLKLPRRTITALVKAGFVTPERGAKKALRFSFQDLIVLRTAQALSNAKISGAHITRALRALRLQLPAEMPLSGLSISAVGDRVVVRDGAGRRQVESGQYLLAFEGDPDTNKLSVIEKKSTVAELDDWYAHALALEDGDPAAARAAYEKAIAAQPGELGPRINLGRLLHEAGQTAKAEQVYRDALRELGNDGVLLYNLGVLLEDTGRGSEAAATYRQALEADPALADGHYNLALLAERLGRRSEAIRHMAQYRRLTGRTPPGASN